MPSVVWGKRDQEQLQRADPFRPRASAWVAADTKVGPTRRPKFKMCLLRVHADAFQAPRHVARLLGVRRGTTRWSANHRTPSYLTRPPTACGPTRQRLEATWVVLFKSSVGGGTSPSASAAHPYLVARSLTGDIANPTHGLLRRPRQEQGEAHP